MKHGHRAMRSPRASPALPVSWLDALNRAGLRGAIATALALSLPADVPERELLQGTVFGIVLFTLIVQGTTAEAVVRLAGPRGRDGSGAEERTAEAA